MKEEKGEGVDECLETKDGEYIRDLKSLQVDLRSITVFNGKKERICSRISGGNRLQTPGSISSVGGLFGSDVNFW